MRKKLFLYCLLGLWYIVTSRYFWREVGERVGYFLQELGKKIGDFLLFIFSEPTRIIMLLIGSVIFVVTMVILSPVIFAGWFSNLVSPQKGGYYHHV